MAQDHCYCYVAPPRPIRYTKNSHIAAADQFGDDELLDHLLFLTGGLIELEAGQIRLGRIGRRADRHRSHNRLHQIPLGRQPHLESLEHPPQDNFFFVDILPGLKAEDS